MLMWPLSSLNQNRLQPSRELWQPTICRTSSTGLPEWESLPALERRRLIEVLVQTAQRQIREQTTVRLQQDRR
jgi:hypothetical protein